MDSESPSTMPSTKATTPSETPKRTRVCVYCGAYTGNRPVHMEAARELARAMARNNIDLVYGGGTVGLMGEVARTLVSLAGPDSVHGIIPEALIRYEREPGSQDVDQDGDGVLHLPDESVYGRTTVVKDMHTRKQMMATEVINGGPGSGFVALSGGFGTLEEVLETTTWNQLGIHQRGVVLLNTDGFYDHLIAFIRHSVSEGFIAPANGGIIVEAKDADEAIRALRDYKVSEATLKLEWEKIEG